MNFTMKYFLSYHTNHTQLESVGINQGKNKLGILWNSGNEDVCNEHLVVKIV